MRCALPTAACLLAATLWAGGATAKDAPVEGPPGMAEAAAAVEKAFAAGSQGAIAAIARRSQPDAWLVADELCYRGSFDEAEALAKATSSKMVGDLAAYIASRRKEVDEEGRRLLAEILAAQAARSWPRVLAAVKKAGDAMDSVSRVFVHY